MIEEVVINLHTTWPPFGKQIIYFWVKPVFGPYSFHHLGFSPYSLLRLMELVPVVSKGPKFVSDGVKYDYVALTPLVLAMWLMTGIRWHGKNNLGGKMIGKKI